MTEVPKGQDPSRLPAMGSADRGQGWLGSSPNIREQDRGPGVAKICSSKDFY